jgi:erythromycin esterase
MNEYSRAMFEHSHPLRSTDDLSHLIKVLSDKRVVMLGESSHGTSEFYDWRKRISLELIGNHGFSFVAVEGDWPPCEKINQYIKKDHDLSVWQALKAFDRWPTWMWANLEFSDFLLELKRINMNRPIKVGFHGLDLYSLMDSIDEVINSLDKIDLKLANEARRKYSCFSPFRRNEKEYARSLFLMPEGCKDEAISILGLLLNYKLSDPTQEAHLFNALQNARIVRAAEIYYRAMVSINNNSWNIRDQHMMDTLDILLQKYGKDAKAIIWEHNSHIGDYRGTDMVLQGQVNLGGLAREKLGEKNVALVGFGSFTGTVMASHAWDGPFQTLPVPEARHQSIEALMHELTVSIGSPDFFLLLDVSNPSSPLIEFKGHRAIGVVYHPNFDRRGNYVPTSLSRRYDAFIFLDETHALTPITVGFDPRKLPDSFPYGSRI